MKTHKYLTKQEHQAYCPKLSKNGSTMTCDDCLVGGLVDVYDHKISWWKGSSQQYKCDTDKIIL